MLSPSSDAQEFGKWLGGTPHELTVTALKPSASNLSMALQLQQLVQTRAPAHGIVITSYDTLLRHGKHLHSGQGLDLLIADEAHCLSHEGVRADAARRTPAAARLLVTATPLSNNMSELYRVFDLVQPGVLGTLAEFRHLKNKYPDSVITTTGHSLGGNLNVGVINIMASNK